MALRTKQKVVARAVGGTYRQRVLPTSGSAPTTPALTRNQLLDRIAKVYQNLGSTVLTTMSHVAGMRADLLARELAVNSILQPALNELATLGIYPRDGTIDGFRRAANLAPKEIKIIVVFEGCRWVEAKTVAGRFRRLKRSS